MKTNIQFYFYVTLFFTVFLFLHNCKSEDDYLSCIPKSTINTQFDMSLPAYNPLLNTGGWIYFTGALAGTRGIIIVNTGTNYKAYDRNAPHICPSSNSTLEVENDLTLICPQDNAKWILTTGQPVAVANISPKTYFVSKNGTILTITN